MSKGRDVRVKILRIVPMFRRDREVEAYIPQMIGFNQNDELELLRRISRTVPDKKWAFVQNSIPEEYAGVLITQYSGKDRIRAVRESNKDVIGYNLKVELGVKELFEVCHAVAVDTQYEQFTQIMALLGVYCDERTKTIALSVNSLEQFDHWRNLGFDYFIGDFYTKTVISDGVAVEKLNPVKANQIALLSEIATWNDDDKNQDLHRMSAIIERDVALTMHILKVANSAAYGGRKKISQIHDAIVRVGTAYIKRWATSYLSTAVTDEKTPEISRVALLRSKFMENICAQLGLDKWMGFFTGLASVAGVMLGMSQEDALTEMHAPEQVRRYLCGEEGIGRAFGVVESYINGNQEKLEKLLEGTELAEKLYLSYMNAETWVTDILRQMEASVLA